MVVRPIEMDKFMIFGGEKPIVKEEAPEEYKQIARETNKELMKYGAEPYYAIEGEQEDNHD